MTRRGYDAPQLYREDLLERIGRSERDCNGSGTFDG